MPLGLVELYSGLLCMGLVGSQLMPGIFDSAPYKSYGFVEYALRFLSLGCLSFIMIHAGLHFHVDRNNLGKYARDFMVAMLSAVLPWIMAAVYLATAVTPHEEGPAGFTRWRQALLLGCFAAPTSAGVLFSMLSAAGLEQTWLFQKAKVLAIFDDIGTLILLIPLKILLAGFNWEVSIVIFITLLILWTGWQEMHLIKVHQSYKWVLAYGFGIAALCDGLALLGSYVLSPEAGIEPMHIEVLLPAFVLGVVAREEKLSPNVYASEHRAEIAVSACFMCLVGLSMPPLFMDKPDSDWGVVEHRHMLSSSSSSHKRADGKVSLSVEELCLHVMALTVLMIAGKFSCSVFFKQEASRMQRLALGLGMCPRGEVGAGIVVVAVAEGVEGNMVAVAVLSLAINLIMTGSFIHMIKHIMEKETLSCDEVVQIKILSEGEAQKHAIVDLDSAKKKEGNAKQIDYIAAAVV